jgi:hypothetical protein
LCVDMMGMETRRKALVSSGKDSGPPLLDVDFEILVDHITRFSLAGIRETRKTMIKA